jgi:hypothetical protein
MKGAGEAAVLHGQYFRQSEAELFTVYGIFIHLQVNTCQCIHEALFIVEGLVNIDLCFRLYIQELVTSGGKQDRDEQQ